MTCCIPPRGPEFCRCKDTCSPPKLWKLVLQALRRVNHGCGATPLELVCYIKGNHNVPLSEECLKAIVKMALKKAISMGFLKRNSCGKYFMPVGPDAREPCPPPQSACCAKSKSCPPPRPKCCAQSKHKCCPPPKSNYCPPPRPKCPRKPKRDCCPSPKSKCRCLPSCPPPCPKPRKPRCPKAKPEPCCPNTRKRTQTCVKNLGAPSSSAKVHSV